MRLIIQASCDEDITNQPTHAVLDVTPDLAQTILRRRDEVLALRSRDAALYEAAFWSEHPNFVGLCDYEASEHLTDEDFVEDRDDVTYDEDKTVWLECSRMCLDERGVMWRGYVRHTDAEVVTRTIPYGVFERALATAGAGATAAPSLGGQP